MPTPLTMPPQPTDQPRPTMQPAVGANRLEQIIRDQEKRIAALERMLSQGNTDWISPSVTAGFTDASKYKRIDGIVYLYLNFSRNVGAGAFAANTPILTLPARFRPAFAFYTNVLVSETGGVRPVYINNLGNVQSVFTYGDGSGTIGWIHFPADL